MLPKNTSEKIPSPNLTEFEQMEAFYPQVPREQNVFAELTIEEIFEKYQNDSQLLNHILLAKAEEDKLKTAGELRQAEEAHLQTKYIEFELSQHNDSYSQLGSNSPYTSNNESSSNLVNSPSVFESSCISHQHDQIPDQSLQTGTNQSPLAMTTSEFCYGLHQEATSIASSSPLSIDFVSPSAFDVYNQNNDCVNMDSVFSSSPHEHELPLFPVAASVPSTVTPAHIYSTTPPPISLPSSSPPSSTTSTKSSRKNKLQIHRTLSYESVMTLTDLNMNGNKHQRTKSIPSLPQQPLDHQKVMEALRAKLRRSTSPYQHLSRPKPSPEPAPPPNTNPTTGILLLDLNSRRRKPSITKNNSSR